MRQIYFTLLLLVIFVFFLSFDGCDGKESSKGKSSSKLKKEEEDVEKHKEGKDVVKKHHDHIDKHKKENVVKKHHRHGEKHAEENKVKKHRDHAKKHEKENHSKESHSKKHHVKENVTTVHHHKKDNEVSKKDKDRPKKHHEEHVIKTQKDNKKEKKETMAKKHASEKNKKEHVVKKHKEAKKKIHEKNKEGKVINLDTGGDEKGKRFFFKSGKTVKNDASSSQFEDGEEEEGGEGGEEEATAEEGGNKCNKSLDLVVALDSSESVREENWTKIVKFTKQMVGSLDLKFTRVGVIRYNNDAEVPIALQFFHTAEEFGAHLDDVFYQPGGTRTDKALAKALLLFSSSGFRKMASKVLVVVTDNPTNDIRLSKETLITGKQLVEAASKGLKFSDVTTFGVGIHLGLTDIEKSDLSEELKMITQDEKGDRRIVEVETFEDLLAGVNEVAGKICLVNGGWSKWSPWSECTASCGGGTRVRIRSCDNPKPANNGTNCTEFGGSSVQTSTCSLTPCYGTEITSMMPQPKYTHIPTSRDCQDGFDFVYADGNQLSASSVYTRDTGDQIIMKQHAPGNGILYNTLNSGAWCAEHSKAINSDENQYIQIDLKVPVLVAKIATQGQASTFQGQSHNWVTFYKLNFSADGETWKQHPKLFTGNTDNLSLRENIVTPPVLARYVRFNPVHWKSQDICMRVGVFKCSVGKKLRNKKVKRTSIEYPMVVKSRRNTLSTNWSSQ